MTAAAAVDDLGAVTAVAALELNCSSRARRQGLLEFGSLLKVSLI